MTSTTTKSAYWTGVRDGAPFILVAAPFAVLFGVIATEAGLNLFEVMSFSFVVIAGAAQFTALELMIKEAPTVVVLISALAVNLRVAMYSAALTPYLGKAPLWQRALISYMLVDQSYALSHAKFEDKPRMTVPMRTAYFFGTCTLVIIAWFIFSFFGRSTWNTIASWHSNRFRAAHRVSFHDRTDDPQPAAFGGCNCRYHCQLNLYSNTLFAGFNYRRSRRHDGRITGRGLDD